MYEKNKVLLYVVVTAIIFSILSSSATYIFLPKPEPLKEPTVKPLIYEGERIVVQGWGGSLREAVEEFHIPKFKNWIKEEYGVNVDVGFWAASGSASITAKLQSASIAKSDPPFDVLESPIGETRIMYEGGLLQHLNYSLIPNANNVQSVAYPYLSPGLGPGAFISYVGLAYNTEKAAELGIVVDSWLDLFDPKFKGRVGIPDMAANTGAMAAIAINYALGGNAKDPELSEFWIALEEQILPQLPKFYVSSADIVTLFETGEVWIAPMWDGRANMLKRSGFPIEIIPAEYAVVPLTTFEIATGTKHEALANLWINYRLSEEAQLDWADITSYGPSVRDIDIPESMMGTFTIPETLEAGNFVRFDDLSYVKNRDNWVLTWENIIG